MASSVYPAAPSLARRLRTSKPASPASPLAAAGLCVLALALLWAIAELIPAARFRDAQVLYHFTLLSRPSVDAVARPLVGSLEATPFTLWAAALVAVALVRRRPRIAVAVVLITTMATLTTEMLKPLLAHPHARFGYVQMGAASFPSGHSTAALALALSAVLVAPARLRPLVAAAGAAFAVAVGCALLILHWHLPSDVLAGYFVAGWWTAVAVAALRAAERRWPRRA